MYYADPDGNQMQFQVDCFDNSDAANAFMCGPGFAANPVGAEFDPDDWIRRLRRGETLAGLLVRRVHEPMSPLRGASARSDAPVPA
jgi:hypothetical protein